MTHRMADSEEYVIVTRQGHEHDTSAEAAEEAEEKARVLQKIKTWLSPTDFDSETSEYRKHLNAHVQGTGQWIFATEQYRRWDETDEIGDLWIRGIPGSGKSVVAANLIQNLSGRNVPVLFFFFRNIILSNRSPTSLLRDFSFQLLDHSPVLQSSLQLLMREHPNVGEVTFDEFWKYFSSAMSGIDKIYCVVDALDEMDSDEESFLPNLLDLGRRNPASIKIALTSRQIPHLEAYMKGSCLVDLRLDRKNVDRDIATYVTYNLEKCEVKLDLNETRDIQEAICSRGKGLFLYARLMMTRFLHNPRGFMSNLVTLPNGMGNMYDDLLREHAARSGTTQDFQKLVLTLITHCARPLRLMELTAVIESMPDRGGLTDGQQTKSAVRTCCGPLLEVCEDEVVQIIHHSLTEFLLDPEISHIQMETKIKRFPVINPFEAHKTIATACLKYLTSGCYKSPGVVEGDKEREFPASDKDLVLKCPFLPYAATFWSVHVAKNTSQELGSFQELDSFLNLGSYDFEAWKHFWRADDFDLGVSSLHIAAYFGLAAYTTYLLSLGKDVDSTDDAERTPIMHAVKQGHSKAAEVLIEHHAILNTTDSSGMTPVLYATKGNHADVLRLLLASGADPLAKKSKENIGYNSNWRNASTLGDTPLLYCCRNGYVESLIVLLKYIQPCDVEQGCLHWAAQAGRGEILSVLLEYDAARAQIDAKDACGNTPLYLASRTGSLESVRALLDHGADVRVRSGDISTARNRGPVFLNRFGKPSDEHSYTPLHGLARRDSSKDGLGEMEGILKLIVAAGCDINAGDETGRTALFEWNSFPDWTARGCRAAFVALHLQYGANPSATDMEGSTPLFEARGSRPDEREAMKLLIDEGADINHSRNDGQTPLIKAAKLQLMDPTMFHDFGTEFNHQDKQGNTALHYACRSWCMEFTHAKIWLSFADPTIINNAGRSPLTNFDWGNGGQGRVDAMGLMVEKGLSLESRDYLGRTALLGFFCSDCTRSLEPFVKELLKLGANVTARDYEGKSVLHLLATCVLSFSDGGERDLERKIKLMGELIDIGADIQAIDHKGNSIFHDAIGWEGADWRILKTSLSAILNFSNPWKETNFQGRNVLHIASAAKDPGAGSTSDGEKPSGRLDFVLQSHPGLDINGVDHEGTTALHIASTVSDINVWKLIKAGANLQSRTIRGRTALHYAAEAGNCNILDLLLTCYLEQSLSVNAQDLNGRTALHEAARSGRPESVRSLLEAGADPHIRDKQGRTSLHSAAEFEEVSAVCLVQREKDAKDPLVSEAYVYHDYYKKRDDAFDLTRTIIASEVSNTDIQEVVRLLLSVDSDLSQLDNKEHTAFDVAISMGSAAVSGILSPFMADLYSNDKDDGMPHLRPLNPLQESLFSSMNDNAESCVKTLDLEMDGLKILETAISKGKTRVVDEILRIKGPELLMLNGSSPLHLAARWGLTHMMEKLLPYVKNLSAVLPSVLHTTLQREFSNTEMVKLLIKNGVDLNSKHIHSNHERSIQQHPDKKLQRAPIHTLATGRYFWYSKALRIILETGIDVNIRNESGETALHIALTEGSPTRSNSFWSDHSLDLLLEYGANSNILNSSDLTPLNTALENQRGTAVLQKLLDHGSDGSFGPKPAISSAIDSLDYASLEILLKSSSNPNIIYTATVKKRYERERQLETPLQNAACPSTYRYSELDIKNPFSIPSSMTTLLLQHGADPFLPLNEGSSTVFHEICRLNGVVAPFIQAGVDLEKRDLHGYTPLLRACDIPVWCPHRAIEREHAAIDLIEGGASINIVDETGSTPLHYAVKNGLPNTVAVLLERGASVTAKDEEGRTPLHWAFHAAGGFPSSKEALSRSAVEALLDAGADPLDTSADGLTALHCLAPYLMQHSSLDGRDLEDIRKECPGATDNFLAYSLLYQRFLDAGCDREARDCKGNTPLFPYVAKVKYYSEVGPVNPPDEKDMRKMFAEHDIHAVNNDGDTLLHVVAAKEGECESPNDHLELFKLLVELGLDPRQENKSQITPLDVAVACRNDDIVALFARNE